MYKRRIRDARIKANFASTVGKIDRNAARRIGGGRSRFRRRRTMDASPLPYVLRALLDKNNSPFSPRKTLSMTPRLSNDEAMPHAYTHVRHVCRYSAPPYLEQRRDGAAAGSVTDLALSRGFVIHDYRGGRGRRGRSAVKFNRDEFQSVTANARTYVASRRAPRNAPALTRDARAHARARPSRRAKESPSAHSDPDSPRSPV